MLDLAKVKVAGSAEEVRELGLDARKTLTCGPERPGVVMCPLWDTCTQPQKNEVGFVTWTKDGQAVKYSDEGAVRSGPGPLNLGVRRSKKLANGRFKVVNSTCTCWEYPHQKKQWLVVNEGGSEPVAICQVVAIEGQSINLPGSKPVVQEDLKVIHVIQKGGIPTLIQPFVRPRDNPDFAASAFAVAELNREEALRQKSDLREFVKLTPEVASVSGVTNPGPAKSGPSSRG